MCVFVADNNAQTFSLTIAEAEKKEKSCISNQNK